jgi:simple sugar transport system substrate-binding protein
MSPRVFVTSQLRRHRTLLLLLVVIGALVWPAGAVTAPSGTSKGKVVVFITPTLGNFFDTQLSHLFVKDCNSYGMKASFKNAENNSATESQFYDTLISSKVDAIADGPVDSGAIIPAIKRANAAKIPVFMNGREAGGGKVELTVRADNTKMGTVAGQAVVDLLMKKNGAAKGTVLNLQGELASTNAAERNTGFLNVVKKYPQIKVISKQTHWLEQNFFNFTRTVASSTHLDAILVASDTVAQGVPAALKGLHQWYPVGNSKHIVLVGIDGDPKTLDLIRKGQWDATAYQPMPQYAGVICKYMDKYFRTGSVGLKVGQTITAPGQPDDGGHILRDTAGIEMLLPSFLITKANAGDSKLWGNQKL